MAADAERACCAALSYRTDPVRLASVVKASAARLTPDGLALSVGSCGRQTSSSASAAVSK
jgi:hypothetical protein